MYLLKGLWVHVPLGAVNRYWVQLTGVWYMLMWDLLQGVQISESVFGMRAMTNLYSPKGTKRLHWLGVWFVLQWLPIVAVFGAHLLTE